MPSVKRPESSLNRSKPLLAKVYSKSSKQEIKSRQASILDQSHNRTMEHKPKTLNKITSAPLKPQSPVPSQLKKAPKPP